MVHIQTLSALPILEKSCGHITQEFNCPRSHDPYTEMVTKIAVGGLLLNVVLSSDSDEAIRKNSADYAFVLEHTALVR